MFVDYVLNGEGHGEVGERLGNCQFEPSLMRPYIDRRGYQCVDVPAGYTVNSHGIREKKYRKVKVTDLAANGYNLPIRNATSLRKDEWLQLDRAVVRIARKRLRAWSDLMAASQYGGFDAMSKMNLEHETMSDPGEAVVDMDARTPARRDSPLFQLEAVPLPITHSDFDFSSRELAVSRNTGTPLDVTQGEASGRRVGEQVEKTLIGTVTGATYGVTANYGQTPSVYGYTNFPLRNTKTDMNAPTGANGPTILSDWLALRELLYDANHFGPFMVYTSSDYDQYLDNLFSTSEPSAGTLRSRLMQIDGVTDIRRLDYLTNTFTVIMVELTSEVVQAVNGMDLTVVQWESKGGLQLNFKVMAIQVPRFRADYDGNCGIAHGTTS